MAISQADEAKILQQLEKENLGKAAEDVYHTYLTVLADEIVEEFKKEIGETTKGSGTLAQSVTPKINRKGFEIQADFYYKFIDDGVNAARQQPSGVKHIRPLVQNSPYSFKNLGVSREFARSMTDYVGSNISSQYAVAVSIKKHGIKAHNITDAVVSDKVLDRIAEDLSTVLGLTVGVVFEKATNETT